jgi:hypothetical protein
MGGLLLSLQPLQESSFLQEKIIKAAAEDIINRKSIFLIIQCV